MADKKSIIEGSKLYTLLQETMLFGPTPKMESTVKNFLIRTPVWGIVLLVLLVCVLFTDNNFLTTNELTRVSKYIVIPFSFVFTVYILYATMDLINTQNTIINFQHHNNCLSDISLDTLSNLKVQEKNAIIYIEKDDCPYCDKVTNKIDNIAYANDIIIYKYDTIYDNKTRKEKLYSVLNELNVDQVPCVVIIKDSNVYKTYNYEEISNGILYEDVENYVEWNS